MLCTAMWSCMLCAVCKCKCLNAATGKLDIWATVAQVGNGFIKSLQLSALLPTRLGNKLFLLLLFKLL